LVLMEWAEDSGDPTETDPCPIDGSTSSGGKEEEGVHLDSGTSAGQIMRLRRALHKVTFERDDAIYRAREIEREIERLMVKVKEGARIIKAYDELKKDHDDMLNSLRVSENVCFQQKNLIEYMEKKTDIVNEQEIKRKKERKSTKVKIKPKSLNEVKTARRHDVSSTLTLSPRRKKVLQKTTAKRHDVSSTLMLSPRREKTLPHKRPQSRKSLSPRSMSPAVQPQKMKKKVRLKSSTLPGYLRETKTTAQRSKALKTKTSGTLKIPNSAPKKSKTSRNK